MTVLQFLFLTGLVDILNGINVNHYSLFFLVYQKVLSSGSPSDNMQRDMYTVMCNDILSIALRLKFQNFFADE